MIKPVVCAVTIVVQSMSVIGSLLEREENINSDY
jgi:hypothetical protein